MSRFDLDRAALARLLVNEPAYRVTQLYEGLHRRLAEIAELTELPVALRRRLDEMEELAPALTLEEERRTDGDATKKWLFRLHDGAVIETVLMHYPRHSTVCISSQAGCAMGCTFCATGGAGFARQLSTGEILEQVVRAARAARDDGRRLGNVVFMGMGEPLANYERVLGAIRRIVSDLGLAARHLTVSSVGVIPGIRALAREPLQVNLAISLHAGNDALRDTLVPLNRRYPLAALLEACEEYLAATNRRLTLEWALMAGVNDRASDAVELAAIARRLHAHVNLIALNPTAIGSEHGLSGPTAERVRAFCAELAALGANATIRRTRGREIDAACGQLAASAPVALGRARGTDRRGPGAPVAASARPM